MILFNNFFTMKKHVAYGYSYPISNSVGGALGGPEIKKQAYLASLASLTWDSGQKCSKNNFDTLTSPKHFWPKPHCGNFSNVTKLKSKNWEHHQKAGPWELGIHHISSRKSNILTEKIYVIPSGRSGVPRLTHFGHVLRNLEPLVNPGLLFKNGFPFFQLKLSRS